MSNDPNKIRDVTIPVTTVDGKTKMESWAFGGLQSDGSTWHVPTPLVGDDHEHKFELKDPGHRHVICVCGHGGEFYPHNAHLGEDGHIYKKDPITGEIGERVI